MAGGRFWTAEETDFLAACIAHGLTVAQCIELFNTKFEPRSHDSIHKARTAKTAVVSKVAFYQKYPEKLPPLDGILEEDTSGPEVIPDYEPTPDKPHELWERAKGVTEDATEYAKRRHYATIQFHENKPIALSFVADQHISESAPVALHQMEEDARLIASTDGCYAILGGDSLDNHVKHWSAVVNSASRPRNELRMFDHYLGFFGGKIAAAISGNHDDWIGDLTSHDPIGDLIRSKRIFFAPDYVFLTVKLPGQDYKVLVRHQARFGSSYNQTHSVKQLLRMGDHDYDVGVVCHKHEAAMEPWIHHGLLRVALRPGSYQHTSGYSRRYGFNWAVPTCPTVVLFPGERRIVPFWHVSDAVPYLASVRQ